MTSTMRVNSVELFLLLVIFFMATYEKMHLASSSSSSYSLETEDGFLISSSFLCFLNEVTEDGFCLPGLPPVQVLARCSAAWQFKVVRDRSRIRRLEQRAVPRTAAPASFFHSSHAHYPIFLQPLSSVGPASLGPVLTGALRRSKGS
jgi:hypothetical protein